MAGLRLAEAIRSFWLGEKPTRDPALAAYFGSGPSSSGEAVSEWTALNFSAVWAAVQLIAGTVASLPLFLYKRLPNGGKERFVGHPLYRLLHDEPNPEMASDVWRETVQTHALLWGNGYCEIQRDQAGRPKAIWPLEPHRVIPERKTPTSPLLYRVTRSSGPDQFVAPENMLHIPGLGYNGIMGYSPVQKARESIGLGLATERFGGTFFRNCSWFGGALQHPRGLGAAARQNLTESLEARHRGQGKAHNFLILEEGMTWAQTTMPLDDAQFLETRKFQITEIARWFSVPPHLIGDVDRSTSWGTGIEQQTIGFVNFTLRRWLVRWEKECNRKLVAPLERNIQFVEHLIDGLLRGDSAARHAVYAIGRQWGYYSADDINEMENRNPLPNNQGKIYLVPTNMAPADKIEDLVDAQVHVHHPPAPAVTISDGAVRVQVQSPITVPPAPTPVIAPLLVPAEPDDRETTVEVDKTLLRDRQGRAIGTKETHRTVRRPSEPGPEGEANARTWEAAVIAMVAGRLIRRELAHAKKVAADPERAAERTEAFYVRFVGDSMAEIRPWLARIRPDPAALDAAVTAMLSRWAVVAQQQCVAAITNGGLADVVRRWQVEREDVLARALTEVINAHR